MADLLSYSENLDFMSRLLDGAEKLRPDFIYIDPPFATNTVQRSRNEIGGVGIKSGAYTDRWPGGIDSFLEMLEPRLAMMRELLPDTGTIAVHMDWHAAHYVKVMMDRLFGYGNFVNEVIWAYKSGGSGSRSFARKHDNILIYSKTKDYYFKVQKEVSYNRKERPYRFKGVDEFQDEKGRWFTLVNHKDIISTDMVGRTSAERTGYATQKPVALLSVLMESLCPERGLSADFFCGSGTLAKVAADSGRRFVCCDSSPAAVNICAERLALSGHAFTLEAPGQPPAELVTKNGRLVSFREDVADSGLSEKSLEELERACEKDPLTSLLFWAEGKTGQDGSFAAELVHGGKDDIISRDGAEIAAFGSFGGGSLPAGRFIFPGEASLLR